MEKELTLRDYMQADDDIEICTWKKAEGDAYGVGELLLEVITGKENIEISAERAGRLVKVLKDECEIVTLDDPIAIIDEE